ncbi:MAG: NusG domain II-containing protein [Lachnospiraceae bacterium]|nr:NusG domain II-containing protein [Lachnospiraceae bacterium]
MRKYLNRNDIILIVVLSVFSALFTIYLFMVTQHGNKVSVYVDGQLTGEYLLDTDMEVEITGYNGGINEMSISDGRVRMSGASCPDRLCIHQGSISRAGQSVVCLPNRVILRIDGKEMLDYDAVTR